MDLSRCGEELSESGFTIVLPKPTTLQNLDSYLFFGLDSPLARRLLSSLQSSSQLKVLNLMGFFLDDHIAEQIGKGCKLLEDITLLLVRGSVTNYGVEQLLLSSSTGLRRLALGKNDFFEDDPMSVISNQLSHRWLFIVTENAVRQVNN